MNDISKKKNHHFIKKKVNYDLRPILFIFFVLSVHSTNLR